MWLASRGSNLLGRWGTVGQDDVLGMTGKVGVEQCDVRWCWS